MSRRLINLIQSNVDDSPDNKKFLRDVMSAIERSAMNTRTPSKYYKPSSLHCVRQMYFTRTGAPVDQETSMYNLTGMADTGTRRHEAIQEVLLKMFDMGYDWKYVDVEAYVKQKQAKGKCQDLTIKGKRGVETHLIDTKLNVSFMCDGIIKKLSTGEYFLFEFKNQTSFKYANKEHVDEDHIQQVTTYCTLLDLDKAFVLYENRDVCTLECPEIFEVTPQMKQEIFIDLIYECDSYVEKLIPPPKCENSKHCRYCKYKTECRRF